MNLFLALHLSYADVSLDVGSASGINVQQKTQAAAC